MRARRRRARPGTAALGTGIVLTLALAGSAAAGSPARTDSAPASKKATVKRAERDAVEARLRAYELPPSEQDLRAMGAAVDEVLVEIARDARVEVLVRARAVSALAYTPTGTARRFLEGMLAEKAKAPEASDRLLLRKAALALGWLSGPGVAPRLGALLEHTDADVRVDAALALGLTRLASAADLLRKHLPLEKDARVRNHVGRQLRVIEAALAPAGPNK